MRYPSDGAGADVEGLTRSEVGDRWSHSMEAKAAAVQRRMRERRSRRQDLFAIPDQQPPRLVLRGDRHGNLLDEAQHGKKGFQVYKPDLGAFFDNVSLGRAITRMEHQYAERRADWTKGPDDWARTRGGG